MANHCRKLVAGIPQQGESNISEEIVADLANTRFNKTVFEGTATAQAFEIADAVAKRYRPWPKGLRTDSLPWFDSPLVQGASRLRYTDKAQVAATGPYWPKGARNKKKQHRHLNGTLPWKPTGLQIMVVSERTGMRVPTPKEWGDSRRPEWYDMYRTLPHSQPIGLVQSAYVTFFFCERLSASMARSLHLSLSLFTTSRLTPWTRGESNRG